MDNINKQNSSPNGNCNECRKKNYCKKACTAMKKRLKQQIEFEYIRTMAKHMAENNGKIVTQEELKEIENNGKAKV